MRSRDWVSPSIPSEKFSNPPASLWLDPLPRNVEVAAQCAEILRGAYDDLPEAAFYFVGGINDGLEKARTV
jgi:F0F1-type ATP synthase beta subunit